MNITYLSSSLIIGCLLASPVYAEGKTSGEDLFKFHGCVNCHGADAKSPVSKVVPKLAGQPADELLPKAKKILSGEGGTKESQIMHAAFYSPSQCDSPPTDEELQAITTWISQLKS
ncbi:MAG: cytochrome c [Rhodothermales bacterium]